MAASGRTEIHFASTLDHALVRPFLPGLIARSMAMSTSVTATKRLAATTQGRVCILTRTYVDTHIYTPSIHADCACTHIHGVVSGALGRLSLHVSRGVFNCQPQKICTDTLAPRRHDSEHQAIILTMPSASPKPGLSHPWPTRRDFGLCADRHPGTDRGVDGGSGPLWDPSVACRLILLVYQLLMVTGSYAQNAVTKKGVWYEPTGRLDRAEMQPEPTKAWYRSGGPWNEQPPIYSGPVLA